MSDRAFFRLFLVFGIWYMCTGQSPRSPWCKERGRELQDQREGLRQELIALRNDLNTIRTNWNAKGKEYRQAKLSEGISQITTLITDVKPFNSSVYEFCKSCPWDRCPGFKSKLERRIQGLNNALKKLNDYNSVPDNGPQIAEAGSGGIPLDPYNLPGVYGGALNGFP